MVHKYEKRKSTYRIYLIISWGTILQVYSREADAFLKCSSLWSSTHKDYFSVSWKKKSSISNLRASVILKKIFNQHSSFPEYIFMTVKQTERCITAQKTEISSLQLSAINNAAHMGLHGCSIPSHLGRHTLYFKGTQSWKVLLKRLGRLDICFFNLVNIPAASLTSVSTLLQMGTVSMH